jgi:hypothetical protein
MVTATSLAGPSRVLDAYSIRARWAPVVLVVLPPLLLAAILLPVLPSWQKLWPAVLAIAVLVLVDQLGRDAGKRLQPSLWERWGGPPTTTALRHRDAANPLLLERQHQKIAAVLEHALPTAAEEKADPAGADHAYQAATAVLIARTRGRRKEYPLIFAENCNYGFRRNMLGLRRWGTLLAGATCLLAVTGIAVSLAGPISLPVGPMTAVVIVSAVSAVIWWRVVTSDWVKRTACSYAERLFEAAETLTET